MKKEDRRYLWIAAVDKDGCLILPGANPDGMHALGCRNPPYIIEGQARSRRMRFVVTELDGKYGVDGYVGHMSYYEVFDNKEAAIMCAIMKARQ